MLRNPAERTRLDDSTVPYLEFEHEHGFFAHEDPRWLVCVCGQYAVRSRTPHGQFMVRLIDRPLPAFARTNRAALTASDAAQERIDLTQRARG
ncbi:unannotated protein [freshwater metagenome]|uniref:Unannotated protein n=1 Tax=freshwater metagenome TaxID=449393 RepID=A0A6J7K3M1_9ZZZZ|nr:hypothetical protein [Actinomycetota bacterium]MSW37118.1 hypothetical protein [Actinomycetota bacterium]MSX37682.1 hypothetical protein [Actinomycetota bacterium]